MNGNYIKLLDLKAAEIISNQCFQIEKYNEQKMQAFFILFLSQIDRNCCDGIFYL